MDSPDTSDLQLPHLPSRYRLVGPIGQGGMGRVFRVRVRGSTSDAALKTLRTDSPDDQQRFRQEMQTLSQLRHENIVRLFDVGTAGENIFFTMELVEGLGLHAYLGRPAPGRPELRWLLTVACKLLDGLEYLHGRGLVHRDIKPSNVMVVAPAGAESPLRPEDLLRIADPGVKILDLGLARERLAAFRSKELQSGTPLYMSPEQLTGSFAVDERSDLYSVGALLYHLVTGRPPYSRLADAIAHREPPPPSGLNPACPPSLSRTILRVLEKERPARPASAGELREELLSVLSEKHRVVVERPRLLPPSFVGRDDSVRKLGRLLEAAVGGRGQVVRLVGERGIGKTWLLQRSHFKGEAFANHGVAHVTGRFGESGPLQRGLHELHHDLLGLLKSRRSTAEILDALGVAARSLLAPLGVEPETPAPPESSVPSEETALEIEPPPDEIARERLLQASVALVRLASEVQPLLVILEDIHIASELEREFIARCARIAPEIPALFVMTYRIEALREGTGFRDWIAPFESSASTTSIDLGPLTDGEVRELAETMLRPRAPLAPDLLSLLVDRSDGYPLSVARNLQVLWERRAIAREGDTWTLRDAGVEGDGGPHWDERLRLLDARERAILATAGVLGGSFDADLLSAVLSPVEADGDRGITDRAAVLPVLRSLVSRGLLVETEDGFAAPADLDASWLERCLSRERLRELHAGVAEALLRHHQEAVEHHLYGIARHLDAAGQAARASEYYLAAARQAASTYANQRAGEAYTHALSLAPDPAAECAIAEELGEFYTRTGKYALALESFERAGGGRGRSTPDAPEAGSPPAATSPRLLDKIGEVLRLQGNFHQALEVTSRCLEAGRDDPPTRARALYRMGLVHLEKGEAATAGTHLEESLRLYRELDAPDRMAKVQWQLGIVEKLQGRMDQATRRFEDALASARKSGQELAIAIALNNLGNIHRARGEDRLARDCLARSIEVRERIADRPGLAISLNSLAQVHHHRGEFASALERTEAALAIFEEVGDRKGVLIAHCNLGEALRLVGRFDAAREVLERGFELVEELKMPGLLFPCACSLGNLEIDAGNPDAAVAHLRHALDRLPAGKLTPYRVLTLGSLSVALANRGELGEAERAMEECLSAMGRLESGLREKLGEINSYRVRLELERGAIETAVETGRRALRGIENGVERIGRAMLYRELGRAFRELGPDWADQTEKHLHAALEEFEDMGSPQNVAAAETDLAVYWSLLGEVEEANVLFESAENRFRAIGATGRLEELTTLRSAL